MIITEYWPNLLFLFLALICNAGMDSLRHSFYTSFAKKLNHGFWNPVISWKNKYVNRDKEQGRRKWLGVVIPAPFTDGWHLLKMFMLGFMMIAMSMVTESLLTDFYLFLLYAGFWNIIFNPIYYKLRKW